jgi:hypothetical protein
MKLKNLAILLILLLNASICWAVPVGNNLEIIPTPRNLGINIDQASQKLTVNGAIALTNFLSNPPVISTQPSIFVKGDGLYYSSNLHLQPFRIDTNFINGGVLNNPTFTGEINFLSPVKSPLVVLSSIQANLFNGGVFRGDGSLLTNIVPSSLKAPDGSPNPALQVDNFGRIGIGTATPQDAFLHVRTSNGSRMLTQHTNESFWSEFATAGVNLSGATIRKWSVGSTGDARSQALGGPNKFYIYQYSDKNDATINQYRMVIDSNGNTGIGTLNPAEKLEVTGNIKAIRFIGNGSGLTNISTSGITNLSIDSLVDAKTSSTSMFLGAGSGSANSSGSSNTASGINSLGNNLAGNQNSAFGSGSIIANINGNNNTAVGFGSGINIKGSNNIAIGANTRVTDSNGDNQLNIGNLITGVLPRVNSNGLILNGGSLNINGGTTVKGILDVDGTIVAKGKILSPNNPWILVHSENFQTTPSGWNLNATSDCGGRKILGGYNISGKAVNLSKRFSLLAYPHTHVKIRANYYFIDSWNNEFASLKADNLKIWEQSNNYLSGPSENICGAPTLSDRIITLESSIDHNSNNLDLLFTTDLDEVLTNESFGIDNLEIWVKAPVQEATIESGPLASDNAFCGPNGYFTIPDSDYTAGDSWASRGAGPSSANFEKCNNLLMIETGHSVTRTWTINNPPRSGFVNFKIERRRSSSAIGFRYWLPENFVGISQPLDVRYNNADIYLNCYYQKENNNRYSCTQTILPL